jgi:hypothetical protein
LEASPLLRRCGWRGPEDLRAVHTVIPIGLSIAKVVDPRGVSKGIRNARPLEQPHDEVWMLTGVPASVMSLGFFIGEVMRSGDAKGVEKLVCTPPLTSAKVAPPTRITKANGRIFPFGIKVFIQANAKLRHDGLQEKISKNSSVRKGWVGQARQPRSTLHQPSRSTFFRKRGKSW